MKQLSREIADEIAACLAAPEVREVLDATEKASDADTGTFEVVISTENVDRYNEVIRVDAWELDHYRNNPVVLWGHDHKMLVGRATSVEVSDGKLIAKGKFAPNEKGQELRKLYDAGFLNATSVGFIPKEMEGNLITKAELLEFSFVSVPANPFALRLAMEKELSVNELVTKGFMHVEEKQETTVPEEQQKGAVAEVQDAVEARRAKWEKFAQVDDLIYAFYCVYLDEQTSVDDFSKLCTETADLLKKIAGGEKAASFAGKDIPASGMKEVRERLAVLKSLSKDSVSAVISALEVLAKSEEPEGTEDGAHAAETDEEKQLRDFSEKRRIVQLAATIIGEDLAVRRQAIEDHRRGA